MASDEMSELVLATPEHLSVLAELQTEADRWDSEHGFEPLSAKHTPQERLSFLTEHVAAGRVFLVRQLGTVVGSFRVSYDDARFWGAEGTDGQAGYIHGLRRRLAPEYRGWGLRLLEIAERHVLASGRPLARLDCRTSNSRLCRYYEAAGYVSRGDVELENGWRSTKYEKKLK